MAATGLHRNRGHRPPDDTGAGWRLMRPCALVFGIAFALGAWGNDAADTLQPPPARLATPGLIADFYAGRAHAPAWGSAERRRALLRSVEDSAHHGLDPADYRVEDLRALAAVGQLDATRSAERELSFTEALVRLTKDLRFGKVDPRELDESWNLSPATGPEHPAQALDALVTAESLADAIAGYAPQHAAYRSLRAALLAHRAMAALGGWPAFPPGATLRPGDRDPRVALLRERLRASGDLAPGAPPEDAQHFDDALREAVLAFQQRHGLEPDAAVGRKTTAALQVTLGQRIDQIRVNLERLRWVAHALDGDHLFVNIPGFNAALYLDGRLAWSSRVVVGRPERPTPSFRARMQYLVLNPDWVVPPTILREDLLPRLAHDPDYLARQAMQVVDAAGQPVDTSGIPWTRYAQGGFPHLIVQAPGETNPLGRIKFMLPNPFSVYLHDTPSKRLFQLSARAFSSGCIRLERPLELALLLLDDPATWSAEALAAAIEEGRTREIPVKRKLPVVVVYHTAEADADGRTHFYPDLYGRDAAVLAALTRRAERSPH